MSDNLKFSFIASLPPIDSAIKINGQGDGARVQLNIPGNELESIIKLQILCGKAFTVTIEDTETNNKSKVKYIK